MDQNERTDEQFQDQYTTDDFTTPDDRLQNDNQLEQPSKTDIIPDAQTINPTETEVETKTQTPSFSPFAYGVENGNIDQSNVVQETLPVSQPQTIENPVYPSQMTSLSAPSPKPKRNKGIAVFCVVLACVIAAIGCLSAGYYIGAGVQNGTHERIPESESSDFILDDASDGGGSVSSFPVEKDTSEGDRLSVEQVVKTVGDSIVSISVYNTDTTSNSMASGIIMSEDGYILTNDHIYSETPNPKFLITLRDSTEYHAEYVSGDSRSDIAILKITDGKGFKPAVFGSSENLTEGESVLAIGQSAGLSSTVTDGIISALDRRISNATSNYSEKYIQTSAAINPGNSGGALVNMYGKVIGVTSAKYVDQQVEGICFAIPIDRALNVVKELQENGKVVSRAKIGVTYNAIDTISAEINDIPTGLYIRDISSDSDLYGKGYTQGDIITKIDGEEIKSDSQVLDIIENSEIGQSIKLTIYKSSTKKTSDITIKLVQAESSSSYTKRSTQKDTTSSQSSDIEDFLPRNDNK